MVHDRRGAAGARDCAPRYVPGINASQRLGSTLMTTDFPEIRDAVARLCADFPGRYWRDKDRARAVPDGVRRGASAAGYLAVLIPEQYGGSGLGVGAASAVLEEIHKSGCNGAACHAQMYTMGTLLKHGSEAQKREYLPQIAAGDAAASGVRRHGADERHGHDAHPHDGRARRRRLPRQRPEGVHLAHGALGSHAAARAHDAARAGREADGRHVRVHRRSCAKPSAAGSRSSRSRR